MNKGKLNKFIGEGNVVIPLYILKCFKKLNLTMDEFVFLMYLQSRQDNLEFNPEKIAGDLNLDIMEVMGYVSVLTDKGYLSLDVMKSENNVLEEVINLDSFYEKISTILIDFGNNVDEDKTSIFAYIEKELGRPLNSLEIKTIEGWLDNHIDSKLIKEGIKRALEMGVYNLKYVDKMLLNWESQGIKKIEDIENTKKEVNLEETMEFNTEDWNWLDDEEEYIGN